MKSILLTFSFLLVMVSGLAQTNTNSSATVRTNKPRAALPAVSVPVPSEPQKIRITSVDGVLSTYYKCSTSVGQVYIAGLPATVKTDFETISRLQKHIAAEKEYAQAETKRIRDARAKIPARYDYDSPASYQVDLLNKQSDLLRNRQDDADDAAEKLKEARQRFAAASQVTAVNTGRLYGTVPIWQVVASKPGAQISSD